MCDSLTPCVNYVLSEKYVIQNIGYKFCEGNLSEGSRYPYLLGKHVGVVIGGPFIY